MSSPRLRDLACSRSEGGCGAQLDDDPHLRWERLFKPGPSEAIEESEGCVAGPVATLSEALTILDSRDVEGAIVDCELPEASEVVMLLTERDVPLVIQTSLELPQSFAGLADLGEKSDCPDATGRPAHHPGNLADRGRQIGVASLE